MRKSTPPITKAKDVFFFGIAINFVAGDFPLSPVQTDRTRSGWERQPQQITKCFRHFQLISAIQCNGQYCERWAREALMDLFLHRAKWGNPIQQFSFEMKIGNSEVGIVS